MGEEKTAAGKPDARTHFKTRMAELKTALKEVSGVLSADKGVTTGATDRGLAAIHNAVVAIEGIMKEDDERTTTRDNRVEEVAKTAGQAGIKAGNAERVSGEATTAVDGLEKRVKATEGANADMNGRLGEIEKGWPVLSDLIQQVQKAIHFVETYGEVLGEGALNIQVSTALASGDYSDVLDSHEPGQIRKAIDRIAADPESDVWGTAVEMSTEDSPAANAFAKSVATWLAGYADTKDEHFDGACRKAVECVVNPNILAVALKDLAASGGEVGDAAQKTMDRAFKASEEES